MHNLVDFGYILDVSLFDDQIFTCQIGQVNLNTLIFYLPEMEFYLPRASASVEPWITECNTQVPPVHHSFIRKNGRGMNIYFLNCIDALHYGCVLTRYYTE